MLGLIKKKIFGTSSERELKAIYPIVAKINALEPDIQKLSDEALKNKTAYFKSIIAPIKDKVTQQHKLSEILPEAFAVCREASRRVLGMRPFDVQLIGGIVLHQGKIAEMKTGEGKTLMATLPVYLNALAGRGVHVVTVNDYLAKRDSAWMGKIYEFLGLTVGVVVHDLPDDQRRAAYACDVTYGQNNEFGFDYLRDNMKYRLQDYVQRDLFYAIVDEVDSILIDEARTPLIISGPTEDSTDKYYIIDKIIPKLKVEKDFTLDEKSKNALLTDEGIAEVEKLLNIKNLYDPNNVEILHHVQQALRAHTLYHVDVDYLIKDGKILIVDEFTGRPMPGRRWSDGLHQAIEAKENVTIENENQTLASITFQNYFRMFDKLAGMTGTAETEAEEFQKIYNLGVVVIPPNRQMKRIDHLDLIYKTEREKFEAIALEIKALHEKGQPVLAGTVSVEKSEKLSKYLKRQGVPHNVLNAKHHEREAEIVKDAGQKGQVTIATNMAGRGTDIVLGEGVRELGGLYILGTERHEARRIDNQLRGRSGRQGDPGASRFYLSLEDDLMRIFASERMQKILEFVGMKEGEAIEHKMVSNSIADAQRRVEGHNFDIRKHLLKYDDVMNQQRKIIYALRKSILGQDNISTLIQEDIDEVSEQIVLDHTEEKTSAKEWNWAMLNDRVKHVFGMESHLSEESLHPKTREKLRDMIAEKAEEKLKQKTSEMSPELMNYVQREIKLRTMDVLWKDHLLGMDHLKEEVGLEGYAQKDPLVVYRMKGFELFAQMMLTVKELTLQRVFHVQLAPAQTPNAQEKAPPAIFKPREEPKHMQMSHPSIEAEENSETPLLPKEADKVGRNDPCPCGSGKKYKKCHGA